MAMEALDASGITSFSESTETSGGFVSCEENELSFDTDVWEISQGDIETAEDPNESIIFEVTSFPTTPSINQSPSPLSSTLVTPPDVVEIKCRRTRHRRKKKTTNDRGSHQQHSSPYAQLCFDPKQKCLVTMLEIDILNGPRRHHSRLPLDAPSPEDYFPWLRNNIQGNDEEHECIPGLTSSSWSFSCGSSGTSTVSGLTEAKDDVPAAVDQHQDGFGEPIILSGWMMDTDAMSDEEADIYWLLNDGKDVWVKIDEGCAKALRKMFSCCGTWKLKRSTPSLQQDAGSPDARDEKRFRYSMLH